MPSYPDTQIVTLLDDAIVRSGRTRDALARDLGILPNLLSMIRYGSTALPTERVERFAEVLAIPLETLVVAGIAAYTDNQGWRAMGVVMRMRMRDIQAVRLPAKRARRRRLGDVPTEGAVPTQGDARSA